MPATYSKPTKIPRWADTSVNILEPPELKKDEGWLFEEIPPSSFENWRTNLIGSWAKWLNERLFDGSSADEFLIKSPGDGTNGLRITNTYVKAEKDFRVESDDLGIEVDGTTSRRIYFDSSKLNWLGYSVGGSRMELYAGGVLALWADATQCFINGDIVIGDDLSVPGGLAVGIASPTFVDDVIQLGDANNKWDFNSGNPRLYFDSNDYIHYDRSLELFQVYINDTRKFRISSAGISADGVYAGSPDVDPTDNCVTASLHGLFGGGVAVGTAGLTPVTGSITLGDTEMLLRYNATLPYLQFDTGDQLAYDRTNNRFQFKFVTAETMRFDATGIQTLGGLNVGYIGTVTPNYIRIANPYIFFGESIDTNYVTIGFDAADYIQFTKGVSRWDWYVGGVRSAWISDSGLAIEKGLRVGTVTSTPVDDQIYADGGIIAGTGLSVGTTWTPIDDTILLGDTAFLLSNITSTPLIQFAANDLMGYNRTSDFYYFKINTTEELRLTSTGLAVGKGLYVGSVAGTIANDAIIADGNGTFGGGLRVGFTGAPTAGRVEIGDAAFYATLATDPYIYADATDYLRYDRGADVWRFWIGGAEKFQVHSTGSLTYGQHTVNGGHLSMVGTTFDLILNDDSGVHASATTLKHFFCHQYTGRLRSGNGTSTENYPSNLSRAGSVTRSSLGIISTLTIPAGLTYSGGLIRINAFFVISVGGAASVSLKFGGTQIGLLTLASSDRGHFQSEIFAQYNPQINAPFSGGTFQLTGTTDVGVVNIGTLINSTAAINIDLEITAYTSGTVTVNSFSVDLV